MIRDADYWIHRLNLAPHPEGGYYKEVYRADEKIVREALPERYSCDHSFGTAIYFLLKENDFSAFHRLLSDEIWHFYTGSAIMLYRINHDGMLFKTKLGSKFDDGELFQVHIKQGEWFAAELLNKSSFSLVGCTVSPGFEFVDFELATAHDLSTRFPRHSALIERLCTTAK